MYVYHTHKKRYVCKYHYMNKYKTSFLRTSHIRMYTRLQTTLTLSTQDFNCGMYCTYITSDMTMCILNYVCSMQTYIPTTTGSLAQRFLWLLIADTVMVYSLLATTLVPLSGNWFISIDDMLAGTVTNAGLYWSITVILYMVMFAVEPMIC